MCTQDDLCTSDDTYLSCVADVRRDLIISTAAVSALASFLMGLLANLPVGMAPGLGLNAYVSFHMVPGMVCDRANLTLTVHLLRCWVRHGDIQGMFPR